MFFSINVFQFQYPQKNQQIKMGQWSSNNSNKLLFETSSCVKNIQSYTRLDKFGIFVWGNRVNKFLADLTLQVILNCNKDIQYSEKCYGRFLFCATCALKTTFIKRLVNCAYVIDKVDHSRGITSSSIFYIINVILVILSMNTYEYNLRQHHVSSE